MSAPGHLWTWGRKTDEAMIYLIFILIAIKLFIYFI
jgi:hypothetical protein